MKNQFWSAKLYPVENRKGTVYLFPAGFTHLWMYKLLISWLKRDGYEVVGFSVKWKKSARELDFDSLVEMFVEINTYVQQHVKNGGKQAVFGNSFGGVIATYVAKRNPEIRSMVLNVTHGSSANLFWDYKPTKKMIDKLRKKGVDSEKKLEKVTKPIESQKDIELLSDRNIICFVSLNDKVTKDNLSTPKVLQEINPSTIIYTTRFGHLTGAIKSILSKSKWDVVLK